MNDALKVLGIIFLILIGGCGFVVVGGTLIGGKAVHDAQQQAPATNIITLAQFNQIQDGMTYNEVVAILGREGVIQSENKMEAGPAGHIHTIMYMWENPAFQGNMSAMFQNGALMQKSQFGLK